MEPPKRLPSLKITSNASGTAAAAGSALITPNSSFQQATSPTPPTPSQGPPKIKLVSKSQPSTPADAHPPAPISRPGPIAAAAGPGAAPSTPKLAQPKVARAPKSSAKKRPRDGADDEGRGTPHANGGPQAKRTKITLKPTTPGLVRQPTLKVKPVGRVPQKPLGEGYDSEAEDRELDPVIEEQLLFRMMPGEHCEYLRSAIQGKQIGVPKTQGGADFSVKFLDDEGRRAAVTVNGQLYAGIVLDLPTITEGMKTWDKKAMVKSSDICQMLLVFAQVRSEEEAKTAPLPKAVEHGHRWPHGITPPMHDARNRRFRKRLSKLEIKNKEAEVDRLLALDREAVSVRSEWIDNKQPEAGDDDEEDEDEYEEDAEGEADDYFGDADAEQQAEEEEEFSDVDDAALEAEFLEAVETPAIDFATPAGGLGTTPGTGNATTPAPQAEEEASGAAEEESEESDEDEEDDEEEDEEGEDGDEQVAGVRIEISNLKKQLRQYEDQLAASALPIMRKRLETNIRNVKAEILLKMSSIGETEED
ncbi:transcription initiation factor TFIID subunit 7 [Staphylotrichum tortipilum]|uniref:Transcription initiation factor TFIID subunit 7 n=1 Tax=Staphylotrichum tortipilum TaxID=2831512 RepID=A0AAN6RPV6_9PEZI|nr:transcription initiation factor TFIID subunit 7 [Staphylotrichum longicolle]